MLRIGRELGDCLLNLRLFRLLGLLLLGRMGARVPSRAALMAWSLVIGCRRWRPNCVRSTPEVSGVAGSPRKASPATRAVR